MVSRIVPGAYFDSIAAAEQAIAEVDPQLVIMLGEYPGRATLTVERLAQNINDCGGYGLADTAGKVLVGEPTDPDGRSPTTPPSRSTRWCWRCARPGSRPMSPTRRAPSCATTSCTASCTTSPRGTCPSAPAGSIYPVCRWSPPWIATWVFRACRWRRRSRDWSPASRRRCSLRPILASPSRHVCRSEGTKLLAARQSCPAVSYGTRNVALSRTNGPASSWVPLLS
ncbi:pyroglutamyl peptidase family protein [Mycobacterium ulcerans str. Harvey]|uniref:Pyroglutamyl-peptidase I n=1 Tax=Mycobacterium ulcerans str. Harvey TaxID=1299332 RepID=A0ABN0R6T7_MYCUL|nr:pyroglutamyl peptidase family protein [Mycobacterium ulcerans str. Harvey]